MEFSALQKQLERYHAESFGWALSCCSRNPREAEDVLQSVYLKVLEGKARYDGKATFKTWLFAVIRNTAADARRRTMLDRLRLIKYGREVMQLSRGETLDYEIFHSQLQVVFQNAFTSLPRRQREVLQLVFYHGLSLSAAAEVMQISIGTARTHYERGKKRIRQRMKEATTGEESRLGRARPRGTVPRPAAGG